MPNSAPAAALVRHAFQRRRMSRWGIGKLTTSEPIEISLFLTGQKSDILGDPLEMGNPCGIPPISHIP